MDKLRKGIHSSLLRVFLLMVFSLYISSITFFTHTHIVGGVTIVHSHFYTTDDQGKPTHEHSGAEIQLIHSLSTYFAAGAISATILIGLFLYRPTTLFVHPGCLLVQKKEKSHFGLRAPPVL